MRPHGLQPTRLFCPWDSPGKNTGVGCHFLLQCMKVESESKVAQLYPTPRDPMDCSLPGSSIHGIFQATVLEWGAIAFSLFPTIQYNRGKKLHCFESQKSQSWLKIELQQTNKQQNPLKIPRCIYLLFYGLFMLKFDRKQQNSLKQLSFNKKIKRYNPLKKNKNHMTQQSHS